MRVYELIRELVKHHPDTKVVVCDGPARNIERVIFASMRMQHEPFPIDAVTIVTQQEPRR